MSVLRQKIIASLITNILALALASFGFGILSIQFFDENYIHLAVGIGTFLVGTILILFIKVHSPLQTITREMKALLTGKSYRKIITSKRNEIGVLAHFFNEITRNLEHISSDVKEHKRIKKELNTAQRIQRDLIPEKPPSIPGLDVIAKTRPASEIGGDTFDFFPGKDRTLLYIGDSTGHGIPAGITMIMVDTLITTFINMYPSTLDIMMNLNKYLKPHLQTTMFMTMILLDWDHKSTMKWVGAGHEHLIHVKTAQNKVNISPAGGIAIGMVPDNAKLLKEQNLKLDENDFLILFSDGIIEAKNVMGDIYGIKRLEETIKKTITAEHSSEDLFNKIAIDVGRFMEGHIQEDDMTLIVIKKTTKKSGEVQSTEWVNEENPEG